MGYIGKDILDGEQKIKNIMQGGACEFNQFPGGVIATGKTYRMFTLGNKIAQFGRQMSQSMALFTELKG